MSIETNTSFTKEAIKIKFKVKLADFMFCTLDTNGLADKV